MIRVLQIVPTLGFGGVAQFLLNYYKKIDNKLIVFDFVTHGQKENFHDELLAKGSNIYYIQSIGSCGLIRYIKQLHRIIESEHYHIIHIHTGHLTGFTAMLCRIFYKGKIFCHAHTTKCVNPKHEKLMPLFRAMARWFGDKQLGCGVKACEYCFGVNSSYEVIHNAISLNKFWNIDERKLETLRYELKLTAENFVLGHVGAFVKPKNHHFIIDIFDYIYTKHKNARLVLVGDGPLRNEIEDKCRMLHLEDCVHFVGIQNDIPNYLHLFDAFILPSFNEGLPVCVVEAQAVVKNVCISDTVDKDVDAGIGNLSFLPIKKESLDLWEKELFKCKKELDKNLVELQYKKIGYEISSSVKALQKLYLESYSRL